MKKKWSLFTLILQLIVGVAAIMTFVVLAFAGIILVKWIITCLLGIAFLVFGIMGVIEYKKNK